MLWLTKPTSIIVIVILLLVIMHGCPLIAGGFWAVILTRPVQVRCWALVWPHSKRVVADEVCALNRQYSAGPATNSLDYRAGAC